MQPDRPKELRRLALAALLASACAALGSPAHADEDEERGACAIEERGEVPVAIQSEPPGAILLIRKDGETVARGKTPFARVLPPGRYELVANAGRGAPERRVLRAEAGEAVAMVIRFAK